MKDSKFNDIKEINNQLIIFLHDELFFIVFEYFRYSL